MRFAHRLKIRLKSTLKLNMRSRLRSEREIERGLVAKNLGKTLMLTHPWHQDGFMFFFGFFEIFFYPSFSLLLSERKKPEIIISESCSRRSGIRAEGPYLQQAVSI